MTEEPNIALMVITDAPEGARLNHPRMDWLRQTIDSAEANLVPLGMIRHSFIVCDSYGSDGFGHAVAEEFEPRGYEVICPTRKLGFAGAIQHGWDHIWSYNKFYEAVEPERQLTHVFHLEGDFTFNANIPLDVMIDILDVDPELAQLALKRQPWNAEEMTAGGICQLNPDQYEQLETPDHRMTYTRHTVFFTTNPCMYSVDLLAQGWPQEELSEGKFAIGLRGEGRHFGLLQDDVYADPKVRHIGKHRTGTGY